MHQDGTANSFPCDERVAVAEAVLQSLLGDDCRVDLNASWRTLSLLSIETPCILAQQQFRPTEWNLFLTLLESHQHDTPYEVLLASLTALPPSECSTILQEAQQRGAKVLKRELSPIQRTVNRIRAKLKPICPRLKIVSEREFGYKLKIISK